MLYFIMISLVELKTSYNNFIKLIILMDPNDNMVYFITMHYYSIIFM